MTTPEPETPQPRDIALEQETPEQADELESQSEADDRRRRGPRVAAQARDPAGRTVRPW